MTAASLPGAQPAAPAPKTLSEFNSLVRPWRPILFVIAGLVLAAALLELVPPIIVRTIVDDHLTQGRASGVLLLAVLYLGATAAVQALTFVYAYLAASVAQRAISALRIRLFDHFQRLPMSYHDRVSLGDTISRCTADVDTLDTVFSTGVATLIADMFRLVTVAVAMVILSPALSLVSLLVLPPLMLITRFFQVRVRRAERANRIAVAMVNTHLQEGLRGIEVVRSFGREEAFGLRFRGVLRQLLSAYNRSTVYSSLYQPITALLAASVVALLLWAGTRHALSPAGISIGTLTAYVLLFQRFFKPITALGEEWQTVQSALSGGERIFQVLALPLDTRSAEVTDSERPADTAVRLAGVVFGYAPGQPVLKGVSFEVDWGEHVALVGRTGAGKTSSLHLLAGLYEPWAGSITVCGHDARSLDDEQRRGVIGVVPQVVQLFAGSVYDNLTLGDRSVEREAVYAAARTAGIHDFVSALPQGYETRLSGTGRGAGAQLSAGQQQLLAIARALVWQPSVLVLDEATAAVDGASDAALRAALRETMASRQCAVLTVAHRLSTAREADRIIVMDYGEVVEQGRPEELAKSGGPFAALLELEEAGWDWRTSSMP